MHYIRNIGGNNLHYTVTTEVYNVPLKCALCYIPIKLLVLEAEKTKGAV